MIIDKLKENTLAYIHILIYTHLQAHKHIYIQIHKLRIGNFQMVDKAIINWFLSIRNQDVPLSAAMTQEKALIFAKELIVGNFQASDGWLQRLKERNHTTFKTVSEESKLATPEIVDAWWETSLLTVLLNYELKDI